MVWYSHFFQNFPQFIVIHTVKGFGIVNKAEIDVFFLELSCFFIIGDWNAKVGSQETSGVTGKFGLEVQNEAGQRLTEFCQDTGHSKHPLPTIQWKTLHMDITRWSTPKSDGFYSLQLKMKKLYAAAALLLSRFSCV